MRIPPQVLLRGFAKFLAVVVGAGVAGALIGIGLAKVSGNDSSSGPVLPTTTERASTASTETTAARTSTGTEPEARTTSTSKTSTTGRRAPAVVRVPRVQVLSAELGEVSGESDGRLVAVRVRVTNRGRRPLRTSTPALLSGDDVVEMRDSARKAAQPLLRPIPVGSSATAVVRFAVPAAIGQRLVETPGARLRIAGRSVVLKLDVAEPAGSTGG